MNIQIASDEAPPMSSELKQMLKDTTDLTTLVYSWLSPGNKIKFGNGVDDNDEMDSVYIIFSSEGKELGHAFIMLKDVYTLPYHISQFTEDTHNGESDYVRSWGEEWFNTFEKRVEAQYEGDIGGLIISKNSSIELALALALAPGGRCTFDIPDPDLFDFEEPPANLPACVSYEYNNLETGIGGGGWYFMLRDSILRRSECVTQLR